VTLDAVRLLDEKAREHRAEHPREDETGCGGDGDEKREDAA
jgi:hypothetical protein